MDISSIIDVCGQEQPPNIIIIIIMAIIIVYPERQNKNDSADIRQVRRYATERYHAGGVSRDEDRGANGMGDGDAQQEDEQQQQRQQQGDPQDAAAGSRGRPAGGVCRQGGRGGWTTGRWDRGEHGRGSRSRGRGNNGVDVARPGGEGAIGHVDEKAITGYGARNGTSV